VVPSKLGGSMSARVVASRAGHQCFALEPSRLDEALEMLAELPSQVGFASLERKPEVGDAWRLLLAAARGLGGPGARERLAGSGCCSAAVLGRPGRCSPHNQAFLPTVGWSSVAGCGDGGHHRGRAGRSQTLGIRSRSGASSCVGGGTRRPQQNANTLGEDQSQSVGCSVGEIADLPACALLYSCSRRGHRASGSWRQSQSRNTTTQSSSKR
jgi:hypothetical protein